SRAAAQSATPPANDGTLPVRPAAVPDTSKPSPMANTRKPAATQSFPLLANLIVKRAVATVRPRPSIAQSVCRTGAWETTAPANPNTAPTPRPIAAPKSSCLGVVVFIADLPGLRGGSADRPAGPPEWGPSTYDVARRARGGANLRARRGGRG